MGCFTHQTIEDKLLKMMFKWELMEVCWNSPLNIILQLVPLFATMHI